MAVITWKNNTNGDWDQASNWSGGVLPGASDSVTLSTLSARIITHSNAVDTIGNLSAITDTLSVTGGTLSVTGSALFDAGLATSGGLLAFLGTKASVTGTFSGAGGQIMLGNSTAFALGGATTFGAASAAQTGVEIDGAGTLVTSTASTIAQTQNGNYAGLVLGGAVTWSNTATVTADGVIVTGDATGLTAALVNQSGASFDLATDNAGINNGSAYNTSGQLVAGSSTFSNAGTFAKTGSTGGTSHVHSALTNTGLVTSLSGTLEFDGALTNAGILQANGGNIAVTGGGTLGGTLSGAGTLAISSATATLASGLVVSVADFLLDGGNVALAASQSITSPLTVTGAGSTFYLDSFNLSLANADIGCGYLFGPGTLTTSGTTSLAGYNNYGFTATGVTWINTGTLDQDQTLYDDNSAGPAFINKAAATYNIEGDFAFGVSSVGTPSAFSNAGTFAKAAGSNASTIYAPFTSTGVIDAQAGTIQFNEGGTFSGTLTGAGQINFGGGTSTLAAGASLTVANLGFDGGSLILSAPLSYAGVVNMQGGSLMLAAGTSMFTGGFTLANAELTLGGGILDVSNANFGNYGNLSGPGTLALSGTTTLGNGNGTYLYVYGGCTISNSGTLNLDNTLYFYDQDGAGNTLINQLGATIDIISDYATTAPQLGADTITNAGTLEKTGGTAVSTIAAAFINSGVVDVATTGTLLFSGGGTLGGTLAGAGTLWFASNTATWSAGVSVTAANLLLSSGSIVLGGNETLSTSVFTETGGSLNLNGHSLTLTGANFADSYLEGGSLTTKGTTTLAYVNTVAIGSNLAWTNQGVVNQHYYTEVDTGSGAGFSVVNAAGASWNLIGDFYLGNNASSTAVSSFDNAGSFVRISGNTYDLVYSSFTNTGTISETVGEIAFEGGGVFGGTITGSGLTSFQNNSYTLGGLTETASASIEFYQSTINLSAGLTLNGTLLVNGSSSAVNLAGQVFSLASMDLAHAGSGLELDGNGTFTTTGIGSVIDWYSNGVMVNLGGGADWANTGTLTLSGLLQLGDSVLVQGSAAGTLTNAGIFDLNSNDANVIVGTYVNGYGARVSSLGYVVNSGTFSKTGGTGANTIYAAFTNTGTLATTSGSIALEDGGTISGLIADSSTIAFAAGSFADGALTVGGGASLSNAATINATGQLTLGDSNAAIANFTNTGTYAIQANAGIGAGATTGSVITNSGTIEKLGGTGRAVIADATLNTGLIAADSGTLALTQSVTGTGALSIGAGATLELGSAVAATQAISFVAGSGTLLLDSPASAHETIAAIGVGNVIDLAKLAATSAVVNSSNQLVISNGSTVVVTLQLAGAHAGNVFAVGSDGKGGSLVTLASNATTWTGTNNDWFSASVWSNGVPVAGTDATVSTPGSYALTLNASETASARSLSLTDANASTSLNGTLDLTSGLTETAGTLAVRGTINGGFFLHSGGTIAYAGGTLTNVGFDGLLDLSAAGAVLSVAGTTHFNGTSGNGNGTISVTGASDALYADGFYTLDDAALSIGNATGTSTLKSIDLTGQGAILSLGAGLSVTQTGLDAKIADAGGAEDAIYNEGSITASFAAGQFLVTGNDFQNDGTITVGAGDLLDIQSASFVNTGKLTVSGSTLTILGTLLNMGTLTATNSLLDLGGPLTGAQLASMAAGGGDSVDLSGSLVLGTTALSVGGGAHITGLTLSGSIADGTVTAPGTAITFESGALLDDVAYAGTISVGSGVPVTLEGVIGGAVIADASGAVLFDAGTTLNEVSYFGDIALPAGDSLQIEGGLVSDGASGTGAGTITAAGGTLQSTIYVLDSETLNNAVIKSGADGGQGLFLSAAEAAPGTLTLGSAEIFNVLDGSTAGLLSIGPSTQQSLGDAIVNDGVIALSAGSTLIGSAGSIGSFTNAGQITLASDALWSNGPGSLTGMAFTNAASGRLSLSSGATLLTNGGGLNNAGSLVLGSLSVLTDAGSFTQTGTTTVGAGGMFAIDGATSLAALAGIGGAGTLGIDGTLALANGTFSMAAAGRISNVVLAGLIENGTVQNTAGTLGFGAEASLENIVWQGPLTIGGAADVQAIGLTVQSATGSLPGTINLAGGATLDYVTATSVDNLTITSASAAAPDMLAFGAAAGTLTLGAHAVLDATAGATEILYAGTLVSGTALINDGLIDVSAGALWLLDPSIGSVVNAASIVMGSNTQIGANPNLAAGDTNFSNTGTVTMAAQDDFTVSGNAANTKTWSLGTDGAVSVGGSLANAGTLAMASLDVLSAGGNATNTGLISIGAGGEVSAGGAFANAGRITMANGASLAAGAAVTNTGTIAASGATPDLVSGIDAAGSSYNAGTLASGVWQVSAGATLTLAFDTALTTDNADIVLSGAGSVLRSLGGSILRLESSLRSIGKTGTLAVLGARGYATSLSLTDAGLLQLQGGTFSAGGLSIAAGGTLSGAGVVSGTIADASVIAAAGGTLSLSGAVSGAGVLEIGAASTLALGAANAQTVVFEQAASSLKLAAPSSFTGTLSGFAAGDSIELVSTAATAASLSGTSLSVTLSGGGTEIFRLAASSALTTLTVTSDGSGDSLLTYPAAAGIHPPVTPPLAPQAAAPAMRFLGAASASASSPAADSLAAQAAQVTGIENDTGGWHGALLPDAAAGLAGALAPPQDSSGGAALAAGSHTVDHLHGAAAHFWRA